MLLAGDTYLIKMQFFQQHVLIIYIEFVSPLWLLKNETTNRVFNAPIQIGKLVCIVEVPPLTISKVVF